jgi:hypothetical protein
MTRGGRLLFESVATWMDGVQSSYSAKTADPSTTLLRSSGRDDKGREVTLRKYGDLDGWSSKQLLRKNCRSLHYAPAAPVGMTRGGRLLFESVATWMDGLQSSYSAKTADPLALLRSPPVGAGIELKSGSLCN